MDGGRGGGSGAFPQEDLSSVIVAHRGPVTTIRTDLQGNILECDPSFSEMVGLPLVNGTVGRPLQDLIVEGNDLFSWIIDGRTAFAAPFKLKVVGRNQEVLVNMVLQDHQGDRSVFISIVDLSDQRPEQLKDELRRSRQFARSLVDSSLDMIMAVDPEGRINEYNPAALTRFGWEPHEVLGKKAQMLYADPVQHLMVQQELERNGIFAGEIQNITKYGEVFTSFLTASRLYDEDGRMIGAMGVSRDITQMLRDQEALRVSEERYRDLFEHASDLIQSIDLQGRFEYVNSSWRTALGYSNEELDRLTIRDIIHPDHSASFDDHFRWVMQGNEASQLNTVFVSRDGRSVYVEGTTSTRIQNGRPVAMRNILRDVTSMYQAREKMQLHEAKMRALFESGEHMFWTVDQGMKLTSFNLGYESMIERLHGIKPMLGADPNRPRRIASTREYLTFWEQQYAEAFSGKPLRFETDLLDTNGERVCNEIFLSPVFGPDGKVRELFGVGHEITEQKVAEDLVREQAARLKAIFESSANMMIWTLDQELRITSCNEHFIRTIEEEHGILFKVGDPFVEEMSKRVAGGVYKPLLARYQATLKGKAQQFEVQLIGRDGGSIWVENFLNPIETDGEIREISCLAYGITDRKEAQMQLLRSLHEKEVLLKEVHHRVKNNLQVISSILSLQTAHVGDDRRILDLLRDSRDRIRSMSFIHESLYQTKDFSSIDMANYMEGLSRNLMMSYSLTGKIALATDLEKVHLVLDQAIPCGLILNELISNALKHAFPGGREGTIHLTLKTVKDHVTICVKDDGVGVDEGFDVARDGNLGLELVRTLVDQLDGRIEIGTGSGVSFMLTFERTK
jgi:PAS domain S-box-containing protein